MNTLLNDILKKDEIVNQEKEYFLFHKNRYFNYSNQNCFIKSINKLFSLICSSLKSNIIMIAQK